MLGSWLSLTAAMLILGVSVVASKVIAETMPIHTASWLRLVLAAPILLLLVRRVGGLPRVPRRVHGLLAMQSLVGMVLFNALLLLGLERTTAVASGIITASTAAVVALLAVTLGERLARAGWIGIALAVAGAVTVNVFTAQTASGDAARPLLGAGLVLLAMICEAGYTVLGKAASPHVPPVAMATYATLYGLVLYLPLVATDIGEFRVAEVPARGWAALVFLTLFVTIAAFILWFHGLRRVPASTAGAFTGLIPVGTILATVLFLDEAVTWVHVLGMAVVTIGIVLVTRSMPETSRKREAAALQESSGPS